MNLGLAGARARVTGGSRGIGQAIVQQLLAENCQVEFCSRTASRIHNTEPTASSEFSSAYGSAVDLDDKAATTKWVRRAIERLGGLNIVVSNVSAMVTGNSETAWLTNESAAMSGAL